MSQRPLSTSWLERWWSPQQIARRLREVFPDRPLLHACQAAYPDIAADALGD